MKLIFIISFIYLSETAKLPKYFNKCTKSDSNLNECILKNIRDNWDKFVQGDDFYHIQKMNPLSVSSLNVKVDNNLEGNITDGYIQDMENFHFKSASFDLDKQHLSFYYDVDKCTINGTYFVTGKLIGLPISGKGAANVTFYGGTYGYESDFKLIERHGKQYIELYNSDLKYTKPNKLVFQIHFYQSTIGEMLSDALNDNWTVIENEVAGSVSSAIADIYTTILNGFFRKIPFDEFFETE